MKKKILALSLCLVFMVVACWASYTKLQSVAIQNSIINSTTIGATTPSTGRFSSLGVSTFAGNKCIFSDGSGNLQEADGNCSGQWQVSSATGCTTGGVAWNTCQTTVTWPVAFADTNYIVTCQGIGATGGFPSKIFINSVALLAASVHVTTSDGGSDNDRFQNIHCIAYHP